MNRSLKLFSLFILVILAGWLLAACDEALPTRESIPIDPIFREYYDRLGGYEKLGEALAPATKEGRVRKQYLQRAVMVFDPTISPRQRFHLAPVGTELVKPEPPVPNPDSYAARYINGHVVYPGFEDMFDSLGGVAVVGPPLTEVRINQDAGRTEQYFENLGFFRTDGDDRIYLLAYGLWKYLGNDQTNLGNGGVERVRGAEKPFEEVVGRLGADLTGFALTDAYTAPGGYVEQIFENVVLYSDPNQPGVVGIRPISTMLGFPEEPAVPHSPEPNFEFYPTAGEMGHNVPDYFMEFIRRHGGDFEITGPPIAEVTTLDGQVYHQCFVNMCLEFNQFEVGPLRVHPVALGYTYRKQFFQPSLEQNLSFREVSLQIWEARPMVSSSEEQVIGVAVFEGNAALQNIEPVLAVTRPDGSKDSIPFPPTSAEGYALLTLPPMEAPNGTLIPYQVCIVNLTGEKFCVKDSYLIWSNP